MTPTFILDGDTNDKSKKPEAGTKCQNTECCDNDATVLSGKYGNTALCDECAEGYEENGDVTGYCSLACQCSGKCDDSC